METRQITFLLLTDFSALFNMESVGNESNVWMREFHELGSHILNIVFRTEVELDPTIDFKKT
jgi:hypothetical protein